MRGSGERRKETSRACSGGPGRDDGDTGTRMRALEVEINRKIRDISGTRDQPLTLISIPSGLSPHLYIRLI